MKAILALADGKYFVGRSFGASGEVSGEVVFNTSMTGYQEILTDPSYCGEIVTMTYPLIGNYGVNTEDVESSRPFLSGFVVKEYSEFPCNWRCEMTLDAYLKKHGIIGIHDIDTRALVLHIRSRGAQTGIISTIDDDIQSLIEKARKAPSLVGRDLVREVTCREPYEWNEGLWELGQGYAKAGEGRFKVVAYDYGIKRNILRNLVSHGCSVTVVPADMPAEEVLALKPDGVFFEQRPWRPRTHHLCPGKYPKTFGQGPHLRHLSRPSAYRSGPGRPNLQTKIRPSGRQPAGPAARGKKRRNHFPEPRFRRGCQQH